MILLVKGEPLGRPIIHFEIYYVSKFNSFPTSIVHNLHPKITDVGKQVIEHTYDIS